MGEQRKNFCPPEVRCALDHRDCAPVRSQSPASGNPFSRLTIVALLGTGYVVAAIATAVLGTAYFIARPVKALRRLARGMRCWR